MFRNLIAIWYNVFQVNYGSQHRQVMEFDEQSLWYILRSRWTLFTLNKYIHDREEDDDQVK